MERRPASLLVAGAVLLAASAARADDGEAGANRQGFMFGFAVGPGIVADLGFGDSGGVGGHFSARVGTRATANMQWVFQLDSYVYDRTLEVEEGGMLVEKEGFEQAVSTAVVAAQYFLTPAVWTKAGLGFGSVVSREQESGESVVEPSGGLALMGGAGIDVLRSGIFALDLEVGVSIGRFDRGGLLGLGLGLGATWY